MGDKVDKTVMTAVTEDYLKALWSAEVRGDGMSINQIAQKMGVVASTASENVSRLKAAGLVEHQPYKKVHLSAKGREVAVGMIRRHRIIETYLHQELGFDWDELHVEAEILEHAISDRLLDRLDHILGRPTRDPHGDPIPTPDGDIHAPKLIALTKLSAGASGQIGRISDTHPHVLRDLCAYEIALDTRIEVCAVGEDGSMTIRLADERGTPVHLSPVHVDSLYLVSE